MSYSKLISTVILLLFIACIGVSQSSKNPIAIEVLSENGQVAPGNSSYVTIQFKIPNGLWMGANGKEGRVPPRTKIKMPNLAGFTFEEPRFPESMEDWVPTKLGKTRVYRGIVNVIVPYSVSSSVKEGNHELSFQISYTPGYSAGRLATHNNEVYSTTIRVDNNSRSVTVPAPSLAAVDSDFNTGAKNFDHIKKPFKFLFNPLDEDKGGTKLLRKIWLDKPGHGKTARFMPFPFLGTTNITGGSIGMGGSFFNATKEGTMTGSFALSAFANEFIGGGVNLSAISCPGAYHNYQFSASFGGEGYRDISLNYENFTLANSLIGYNVNLRSLNEPRMRIFGVGPLAQEEDEAAYETTRLQGIVDLYVLPIQNLRFGIGVGYDNYDVGTSFDEVIDTEGIDFLQSSPIINNLFGPAGGTSVSLRGNIIFDHRDQEFAPSRGFYTKVTVARHNLSDIEDESASEFTALDVDMRQYFSGASQRLIVLMRAGLSLKSESDIPFNFLSSLGGPSNLRAYDFERWLGQHSAFGLVEMRYSICTIPVLGYPMSIEMGAFLDVGQVFGDGQSFGDELNVDPGVTIRMINKPNVGLVFNIASGEDGVYVTGGIGLPF